jgi:opacity protein-like surface antigen
MKVARLAVLAASFFSTVGGLLAAPSLNAQALPTANRRAEISVFGGYMLSDLDFDGKSKDGFAFGADFTVFPHFFVDPSVEVRYDHASIAQISEHAYLIGPRVQKDYRRVHPYANFLVGIGGIDYHPAPFFDPRDTSDSGRNYSIGGGVDFDVARNISVKVDYQQQFWNLGKDPNVTPTGDYTLSPTTLLFGVTYHIPFSGLRKQRELY